MEKSRRLSIFVRIDLLSDFYLGILALIADHSKQLVPCGRISIEHTHPSVLLSSTDTRNHVPFKNTDGIEPFSGVILIVLVSLSVSVHLS